MATVIALAIGGRAHAQDRFLGKAEIDLFGFGLKVEPSHQVVPKDISTIVSTFLQAPAPPQGQVLPFAPDAVVKATLRGPGVGGGLDLTAQPNSPLTIPPLGVAGTYALENIRLESGGQVLMQGTPSSVTIDVIEKLLVTQVTARALTAQEIREKGIVFDKSNFQAYNFTAAFAIQNNPVQVSFPVVLPALQSAQDVSLSQAGIGSIDVPKLPELKTIIPDTLKLQTQIPNLKVVGFTLQVQQLQGQTLVVPPIPGVVVIPGDIGFLNQFFSVMLMVGNAAPGGSNLVVSDLTGQIFLPPGADNVVGTDDDPLAMAQTTKGPSPKTRAVVRPGSDGQIGTADDITTLGPGDTGSAEYLVEGRHEGTFVINFAITGTLHGLPVGPVQVTGQAAGSVLVRNPNFSLTFTHPDTVQAGEPYTLDVTVSNTSQSPANFVSVNLSPENVTGAEIVGDATRQIDSIPPGDSETVTFDLVAHVTGSVTAATLDADGEVQGRFSLKSAVGELGVPVSPDSVVLPEQASGLPANVRNAMLGLIGKAWAVATSPAAALPKDVARFSKQIVFDRTEEGAEAGFRILLHDPIPDSVAQLEMDFAGSDFARLPGRNPNVDDLAFAQSDFRNFDALRRQSIRGDVFADAVAAVLAPEVAAHGVADFHRAFAEQVAYRPPHLSVLIGGDAGPLPYMISLVDSQGRRVGGVDATGKVIKQIPFGDLLTFVDANNAVTGQMILIAAPDNGDYHLRFDPVPGADAASTFAVSVVVPAAPGGLRQVVFQGLTGPAQPTSPFGASDPVRVFLDLPASGAPSGGPTIAASIDAPIAQPAPQVVSVVQQANADLLRCTGDCPPTQGGRIVAVLFNEEVTPASVQDKLPAVQITNYAIDNNKVVGVALQPGNRIAFVALRDGIGPFVSRTLTISNVADAAGRQMTAQSTPIETTVTDDGAVLDGQVLNADGSAVAAASVNLFVFDLCKCLIGVSSKAADASGRYSFDWVPRGAGGRVSAFNPVTDDAGSIDFLSQRNGQRLNVNVVFLGRGTIKGRTLAEDGTPLAGSSIRVTSLTDMSSYGATSDAGGVFAVSRVPVGNIFIEAVNVHANARGTASDLIPVAGGTTSRDVTLFSLTAPTVVVKRGTLAGHVLSGDGASPIGGVPVVAYYQDSSQAGVTCTGRPGQGECAVGTTTTDAAGGFSLDALPAGQYRVVAFNQATLQQGEARVAVPVDGSTDVTILLAQGLATVNGLVLDAAGKPVANARVGGGLSLTTTDASGHFTLKDVPLGHRPIVAVSDQLNASGTSEIDLVLAGQAINVTIVLQGAASIAGTIFAADGTTPMRGTKVYLFFPVLLDDGTQGINVVATATTDAGGKYTMSKLPLRSDYTLSAFRSDFSDGNVKPVVLKFNNQVVNGTIVFRGRGGHVRGGVFDSDGTTPLKAKVGISSDQPLIAGGLVGTAFQYVSNYAIVDSDFTSGQFAFDNVWVGPFTVTAAGQFSPEPIAATSAMPAPGSTVQVDIRLQATSTIQGTVFQPDGVTRAARGVQVHYRSSAFKTVCVPIGAPPLAIGGVSIGSGACEDVPQGIQSEDAVTDDQGNFTVPLVTAGPFSLTALDPATNKAAQIAGDIKAGQTGTFSIRLLGTSTLTINVRGGDSTTPIPSARVEVTQVAFPNKTITSTADAAGRLVLGGGDAFSEGEVIVKATDLGNGFAGRASGKVTTDGGNVSITVFLFTASGSLSGTVFRPDGLTPVPNATVTVDNCQAGPLFGDGCIAGGSIAFAVTDAAGAYHVDLLPLGAFNVDVFDPATARRGAATGHIDLDKQQVAVNITEAGRGLVTGTVLEAASLAPLPNWQTTLQSAAPSGRPLPALQTTTGVDGSFSFPGVTVGDFRLSASQNIVAVGERRTTGVGTGSITADGERVDVPIVVQVPKDQFGRVEGTVFNPDATAAANVSIAVCSAVDCDALRGVNVRGAVTASDGTFAIDHVPVGPFSIRAQAQATPDAASDYGRLLFDGDIVRFTLTMVGLSQLTGQVVFGSNSQPAPNVQVTLTGNPSAGCPHAGGADACTLFADANGQFTFIDVPARTFMVVAADPSSGLRGVASGSFTPGQPQNVRVVLQPTTSVSGRVLFESGSPAANITAQLTPTVSGAGDPLFQVSDQNGQFTFDTVPTGTYVLTLEDPTGPGIGRQTVPVQTPAPIVLGDITLDETPPSVVSTTPAASAVAVPQNQIVQIVFSKPVDSATVTDAHVTMATAAGPVAGVVNITSGNKTVTFQPLAPLSQSTLYTIGVSGITDLFGKAMPASYTASFTTIDLTPPKLLSANPAPGTSGVSPSSTVRVQFDEPIDPNAFRGPPIVLLNGAASVAGRIDLILGNTTLVFTPAAVLDAGTLYTVQAGAAADLSGNTQAQGLTFAFTTTTRTPPQIAALVAAGGGTVIKGGSTNVTATIASGDVAVVDFFLNDQPAAAARSAPFVLTFKATPGLGKPGDRIKVSALATDTSGNRSAAPAVTFVTIVPDQPPAVTIVQPADATSKKNGDRVTVAVHAADDLGVSQISFRAQTGKPQDAAAKMLTPAPLDDTETFAFTVPLDAPPGSTITITASAVDTSGQVTTSTPVRITVLDSVPPSVTITGTTTGTRVAPGQQTNAIVSVQDAGGVASITFTLGGVVSSTQTTAIAPVQNSVASSFAITIPASAHVGDALTLDASATDAAGNVGNASRVILPVADLSAPTLQIRTSDGSTSLVPGTNVTIVATADDESAVARVALSGQGAFAVSDVRQVSPPSDSAQMSFQLAVPSTVPQGAVLNLSAVATDIFGNTSAPATLALTVKSLIDVVLPASLVVAAGDSAPIAVQLSAPAGAAGVRVDLGSADATIAAIDPFVQFASGESAKTAVVGGVSGGDVSVTASVQGVQRTRMTVTVEGGVVSGTVFNPQLQAVGGARVIVASGATAQTTTTDGAGRYRVIGVGAGPLGTSDFTVQVFDPASQFIGFATGTLNVTHGSAQVDVVLAAAGTIGGVVRRATGLTPVGAGARVDIFAPADLAKPLGTTFTDANGAYSFPIVTLGTYTLEASDVTGNRGRATSAVLTTIGQHLDVPITYLGRGIVAGTVKSSDVAVPNIPVTLTGTSLFGLAQPVQSNAGPDGTFRFDNVFVGSFTVQAHDAITNLVGTTSGTIAQDLQVVTADVSLAKWANLQGTVFRTDGVSPVPNADVTLLVTTATSVVVLAGTTDAQGTYAFAFAPLGSYELRVNEPATRGLGRATGTLSVNAQTVTQNVTLFGQGTVVVTVLNTGGQTVTGAQVNLTVNNGQVGDSLGATSDANGSALLEHVLAASFTITASSAGLTGFASGTLAAGEMKQVSVTLQPTGSIAGTVFMPDGQTPAFPASVALCDGCPHTAVASDGTFVLSGLSLGGQRTVIAYDAQGRKRALAKNLTLTTAGQVITANLTFVGLGTVTGRVLNPDSSSAQSLAVTVHSLDPDFGGFASPTTNAAGFYEADLVVVGPIAVSAGDASRGLLGEATGTLAHDGDTLNLDVQLKPNAITLPVTKQDGNQFIWDIQKDGSIANGFDAVFNSSQAPPNTGGANLDIISGGVPTRFTGANIGTTEDGGREVVVAQQNVSGLNVTRKILVSADYFARYLEILTNPTAAPITVDVRVESFGRATGVRTTSSGDAALTTTDPLNPDRWAALTTGPDQDPFATNAAPQVGFAFDGAGATRRVSSLSFTPFAFPTPAHFDYVWTGVTVPPGQTVAFMHFAVQQYGMAAASASLDRLVQLPPEALESLSPGEIAAIQNFAVPSDGTSPVAPLPPLAGTIAGQVFESDGTTPALTAYEFAGNVSLIVTFRSGNIFFGRTYTALSAADATFSFGPTGSTSGPHIAATVPIETFTLGATDQITHQSPPPFTGSFLPALTTATANIVFSNTGIVKGIVRRTSGAVVAGARIVATQTTTPGQPQPFNTGYALTKSDGSYVATEIPPGVTTVAVSFQHPQAVCPFPCQFPFRLQGSATVTVVASQTLTSDLTIQPTGAVTGTVRTALGFAAVNAAVDLIGITDSTVLLEAHTDSAGVYHVNDAPLGSYTVKATDPASGFAVQTTATVVQDQTATANLTLLGTGTVQLTVTFPNGQPASGANVEVQKTPLSLTYTFLGATDANGRFTITNVPVGAFIVRAHRPGSQTATKIDVFGAVATPGQTVPLAAVLPPVGTVQVQVNSTAGAPVQGAFISISDSSTSTGCSFPVCGGTTDANGQLTIANIPATVAPLIVQATDPVTDQPRRTFAQITSDGQVVAVTIVLGAAGSVNGHVTRADGSPAPNVSVQINSVSASGAAGSGQTDAQGAYTITGVASGLFRVTVSDLSQSPQRAGSATGQIVHDGDSVQADVALTDLLLATTLTDANGFGYTVSTQGSLSNNPYLGGYVLTPLDPATSQTLANQGFGGNFSAATELNGRQLVIRNFSGSTAAVPLTPAGLTITRKIYVSPTGYFARYLEIFENPTANPIQVGLQVQADVNQSRVTATSSGGASLSVADRWIATDNQNQPTLPNVAHVFEGANAPLALSVATSTGPTHTAIRWNAVTVPAGGRVIFMHFTSEETNQAGAVAAAQRLVQLPPEALAGLSAADAAAIQNFAVPADLSSAVAAFATVSGRVLAADASTPVPGASVLVNGSSSPIFKPTITVQANAAGQYTSSTLGVGPFSVQAKDALTGALTPVVSSSVTAGQTSVAQDLVFTNVGVLTGAVRFGSGVPVSVGQVTITGGQPSISVTAPIAVNGAYFAGTLNAGTYNVQANVAGRLTATTPALVTTGQTTTLDLRLPALATILVTVTQAGGAPLSGALVYVNGVFKGGTNASGVFSLANVVEGPFTVQVRASDNVTIIGAQSGAVQPADDGRIIDLTFAASIGSITGTVFAADAATPIASASVDVFDVGLNALLKTVTTSAAGAYAFTNISITGGQGFKVVAHAPANVGITAQATGIFTSAATVINLNLPLVVVRGAVLYFDGATPTVSASVTLAQEDASGNVAALSATTDAQGRYAIVGVASGAFEIRVVDSGGALEGRAAGTVTDVASPPVVNVRMGPSGTVAGTVRDSSGNVVRSVPVSLASDGAGLVNNLSTTTDSAGTFTFTRVPLGALSVEAVDTTATFFGGASAAALGADGATVTVDVAIPQAGTVSGTVFLADGVTPARTDIRVAGGSDGPGGVFVSATSTDTSGHYQFTSVPAGPITTAASVRTGTSTGTVPAGGSLALNVTVGSSLACAQTQTLAGSDGFKYDAGCGGELHVGGATDAHLSPAYAGNAYSLRVNGSASSGQPSIQLDANGRQFVYGPYSIGGVLATRKLFVPASGGFARYLDTIANPTGAPITIDVQIEGTLAGATHVAVDPATTSSTYAVTQGDASGKPRPALAHVFGGSGAAVSLSAIRFQSLIGTSFYRWSVTVPAGQSMTLMHFAVQRESTDAAGAAAQAQALVNLTDPNALAGMTPVEKAQVVNFRIQ